MQRRWRATTPVPAPQQAHHSGRDRCRRSAPRGRGDRGDRGDRRGPQRELFSSPASLGPAPGRALQPSRPALRRACATARRRRGREPCGCGGPPNRDRRSPARSRSGTRTGPAPGWPPPRATRAAWRSWRPCAHPNGPRPPRPPEARELRPGQPRPPEAAAAGLEALSGSGRRSGPGCGLAGASGGQGSAGGPDRLARRQLHLSPQLRAAITARDQGCIGCGTEPEWCVSHHIIEWQHGGPTQQDNLVLLCHPCHHSNWTVQHHPDTNRPYLKPPWQKPPPPPPNRPKDGEFRTSSILGVEN